MLAPKLVVNKSVKYARWNPVPKELEQQVITYYLAGGSASSASKKFGVCAQKILERNNISTRSKKEWDLRNKNKEQEIIFLYLSGKSVAQIMKIIKLGEKAIDNCLARNNIKKRTGKEYLPKSSGKESEIISMYQSGISASDTGKVFDICEATVLYVLKKNKVQIRPCGISKNTKARGSKNGISRTKEYQNEKTKNNRKKWKKEKPLYGIMMSLRSRISSYFSRSKFCTTNNITKYNSTLTLLGADKNTIFKHIEAQFTDGMTWENHARNGWHIDHKIPLCSAKTEEEIIKLLHYTNLQPLWATDNHKKGGKLC
jgi:hypothetical protein